MQPYQIDNILDIIRLVVLIGAGAGGITLVLRTWFNAKARLAGDQVKKLLESMEHVVSAVEDQRAELAAYQSEMRERMAEISDRVEFTERMLTKGGAMDPRS